MKLILAGKNHTDLRLGGRSHGSLYRGGELLWQRAAQRWLPWEQPRLTANDSYGGLAASSINTVSNAQPYLLSDGIKEGTATSWEAMQHIAPAWVTWTLPVTLRIRSITLYNKYSSTNNVTKNVRVYADEAETVLIGEGVFAGSAFSAITIAPAQPVQTNVLRIRCVDSYVNYVGIGEIEIDADYLEVS